MRARTAVVLTEAIRAISTLRGCSCRCGVGVNGRMDTMAGAVRVVVVMMSRACCPVVCTARGAVLSRGVVTAWKCERR